MDAIPTADSWPHTRRPLPWLIAGFLACVFLVPIDAIQLKVHLPFSSTFDRFFITVIVLVWLGGTVLGNRSRFVRLRPKWWAVGMIAFVAFAILSIVVNVPRITNLGEWGYTEKKLAVLFGLVALFAVFALTLRVSELRAFSVLIVVLAAIAATGVIYEEKSGENPFYTVAEKTLTPIATIEPAPTESSNPAAPGRPMISGPTRHALSITSLLGMALPFALVLAAMAPDMRQRLLWGALAILILSAALLTQRRSGAIVPAVAILALFALRPRQLLKLAPLAIAAVVVGLAIHGTSINAVSQIFGGGDQASTEGRTADYEAVVPDLLTTPALGRGFGTLNSIRVDEYRIFDNEYLGQLYQGGLLGLLAFLAMILTPVFIAWPVARSDSSLRGPPALAAAAGCLAFAVATGLYDILSFPQAPYLFLFLAAMCTCSASVERERVPATSAAGRGRQRVRRPLGAIRDRSLGHPV
jgi:hypothetical protein